MAWGPRDPSVSFAENVPLGSLRPHGNKTLLRWRFAIFCCVLRMRTRTNLETFREALGKSGVRRSHRVGRTVPAERLESKNELLRSAQAEAFLLPCPRRVLESCKKIIL